MRRFFLNAFVPAAVLALGATPSAAQESTTRGFVMGLHASGASLAVESQDRNNAGGAGLFVGYGVNRRFTIFAQADAAEFDNQSSGDIQGTWAMGHFDLGVRFNFANSLRSVVPFLQGSLGARAVGVNDARVDGSPANEVSFTGSSLTLGGGVDFYFTETFALDLALLWTGGTFDTIHVNNASLTGFEFDATSGRFNLGVVWWP
jgi:opacity protein-like surface antigen